MRPSAATPAEVAACHGLRAAAHRGDLAAIARLAVSKTPLQTRDSAGRTALHGAAFARQTAAVQALLQAGADPGAQEHVRFDAVTIAAVADDE